MKPLPERPLVEEDQCANLGPPPQSQMWASWVFPFVFVSGKTNGNNEHTVLDVTGTLTESSFESALGNDLAGQRLQPVEEP